jgi:rubrerythrin
MKIIKKLSEKIAEEIEDADCYIRMALEYQEQYPEVSRIVSNIAAQEMDHMNSLHQLVVQIIDQYRRTNGEPPPAMQAVYDYLHEKHIERAAEVKAKIAMYKNQ